MQRVHESVPIAKEKDHNWPWHIDERWRAYLWVGDILQTWKSWISFWIIRQHILARCLHLTSKCFSPFCESATSLSAPHPSNNAAYLQESNTDNDVWRQAAKNPTLFTFLHFRIIFTPCCSDTCSCFPLSRLLVILEGLPPSKTVENVKKVPKLDTWSIILWKDAKIFTYTKGIKRFFLLRTSPKSTIPYI